METLKPKGIMFKGPLVRAILAGTKTQTRRLIKPEHAPVGTEPFGPGPVVVLSGGRRLTEWLRFAPETDALVEFARPAVGRKPTPAQLAREIARRRGHPGLWSADEFSGLAPYGPVGRRLWVRETWGGEFDHPSTRILYRADCEEPKPWDGKWRPSLLMPRWASRITLEVTEVRVQRLQDISEEDAKAEGVEEQFRTVIPVDGRPAGCAAAYTMPVSYRAGFANLWDKIGREDGDNWDSNPWVWAYTFRRVEVSNGV